MPNPPLRLANPYAQLRTDQRSKVTAGIDPEEANYLFKKLLPEQGHMQAIVATFIHRLYLECISRRIGFRPGATNPRDIVWDDCFEQQVAEILTQLNFNPNEPTKSKRNIKAS